MSYIYRLLAWSLSLFRVAFPPDPNAVLVHQNYERAIAEYRQSCKDAAFLAFIQRAKSHDHYLGGRFKLLRSPLLAV